jgi:hypothetical protein
MPSTNEVVCGGSNGVKFTTECSTAVIVIYFQRQHLTTYLPKVAEKIQLKAEMSAMLI